MEEDIFYDPITKKYYTGNELANRQTRLCEALDSFIINLGFHEKEEREKMIESLANGVLHPELKVALD